MSSIFSHSVQDQLAASGAPAQSQYRTSSTSPPTAGYVPPQNLQATVSNSFLGPLQGPVYGASPAQNQYGTSSASSPTAGYVPPQNFQAAATNSFSGPLLGPLYGASPAQTGYPPYQYPNPSSANQYLQPLMQPAAATAAPAAWNSPWLQYPLRPLSAPPVKQIWPTTNPTQPQIPERPSSSNQGYVTDPLITGFKKLAINVQPSTYPSGANDHDADAEPRYHSFRLTPLPPTSDCFRLVEFSPVPTPQSPISCKLHRVSLRDHPEYIALSYPVSVSKLSGRFRRLEQIACDDGYIELYGGMLDILYSVLNRHDPMYMWIDCCCMSQHDPDEKAEQIAMMKHIYRKAKETVIWLEEPSDNALLVRQAFETLKIGYTHFNNIETRQAFASKWASTFAVVNTLALNQLLQKVYFSRSWMLQEAALSSHAVIHCCTYRIKWADFCEQLACLMRIGYIEMVMTGYASALTANEVWLWLGRHKAFVTLWQELEKQRRRRVAPTEPLPLKLKQLMRLTRGMNASDLRDRVYALLGLCSDSGAIRVDARPQYTVAMLYHQLALYFTKSQSSRCDCDGSACPDNELSFIGDAGARSWNHGFFKAFDERHRASLDALPSWVPVWEYRSLRTMWTEAHSAGYKAGGRTKPAVWYDPDVALPHSLFATGTITSQIQYITTPCPTFDDYPEVLELDAISRLLRSVQIMGGWFREAFALLQQRIPPHHSRTEDFCRTLCGNISHMEADFLPSEAPRVPISNPRELERFFSDCMEVYQLLESYNYDYNGDTVTQGTALASHLEGATKWWELTGFTLPYSKFFLSNDGKMGVGPSLSQVGDRIAVFNGAPMPAVLRSADQGTGEQYQLVGPAYVHGLMDGEAYHVLPARETSICLV
ncbi:hypothetical protein G647_03312 [Cladophialophora carrionii CBS 160.54]|uniref:Heterokaryon incompatibility domain-containing protein n=1 Tax=Cladophialophora carrionii CBS 160.54 TaxID=1279043 RepID=V9DI46_9EURO|nr:uncharacterized protein G647_03312 [Cladophialophora carrionii CBS 160.54]ETI26535.1 hypothetical protein G647_03312 [Cladophialophora carrionii CBS 160.54]